MSRMKDAALITAAAVPSTFAGYGVATVITAEPHSRKDGLALLGALVGAFVGYGMVRGEQMDGGEDGDGS